MSRPTRSLPRKPSQAEIEEANLAGAELTGCIFRGLDLRGRDLTHARLIETLILDCDLTGANLSDADLTDAELDGSNLTGVDLSRARMVRVRGERVRLTNASLVQAALTEAMLPEVILEGADLSGAALDHARLQGAQAQRAILRAVRGEGVLLEEADLSYADLRQAHLAGAQMEHINGQGALFQAAFLQSARLDGADLRGAFLDEADLRRAVLRKAWVEGTDFGDAWVTGAVATGLKGATPELLEMLKRRGATTEGFLGRLFRRRRSPAPSPPTATEEPVASLAADSDPTPPVAPLIESTAPIPDDAPRPTVEPVRPVEEPAHPVEEPVVAPDPPVADNDSSRVEVVGPEVLESPDQEPQRLAPFLPAGPISLLPESAALPPDPRAFRRTPDPEPELFREPKPDPLPVLEPESELLLEPEPEPEPEPELEPEPEPEPLLEPEIEPVERAERIPTAAASSSQVHAAAVDLGSDSSAKSPAWAQDASRRMSNETPASASPDPEPQPAEDTDSTSALSAIGTRLRLATLFRRRGSGEFPQDLGPGADLSGRDLRRLKLTRLDLTGANLTGARLDGADLSRTCLAGARLDRARFARVRLIGADLSGATAEEAIFDDADLTGADLRSIQARGASFIGVDFDGVRMDGADLSRSDLSAARLADVDMADADVSGALLEQTDLAGARLARIKVVGAEIDGALGLSSAQLDELEARGAVVSRFSLARLAAGVGTSQIGRAIGVGLVAMIGVYLALHYISNENTPTSEIEGRAIQEAQEGDIDAARERYTELIERAEKPVDRVYYRFELASLLATADRHDEAISLLEAALMDTSGERDLEWETRLRLATTLRGAEKLDEEIQILEGLRDAEGVPPRVLGQALVALSDAWRRMGFENKALKTQEDVRTRFANNPEVILAVNLAMADTYQARGETEKALKALRSIEGWALDDEQRASLMARIAQLLSEKGDDAGAQEAYEDLLNRYPDYDAIDGDVLLDIARLALKAGDRQQGERLLDQLLAGAASPGVMARARLAKARLLVENGQLDQARVLYTNVLEDYPNDDDAIETARRGLFEVMFATEGDETAEALIAKLLASGDKELAAQAMLGRALGLQDRGDLASSRTLYEEVLATFPDNPGVSFTARTQLASLLVAQGSYPEAINAWRDLISQTPEGDTRNVLESRMADTWLQSGQLNEAELKYNSILSTTADDSETAAMARIGLARVAAARGDPERARILWKKVVESVDDPLLAGAALEELAGSYLESGRDREALLAYQGFLSRLPDGHEAEFSTHLAIGGILVRLGELDRALGTYEALLAKANQPARIAEIQLSLGEIRSSIGDSEGSAEAWRAVLAMPGLPTSTQVDAAVGLARAQLNVGNATGAFELSEHWLGRCEYPAQKVQLMQVQVQALKALGRLEEASRLSKQMLEAAGDDVDAVFTARLELASERINSGEFDEAIALYRALGAEAQDRPTQAAMALSEAQVLAQSGRLDASRALYQQVAQDWSELSETVFDVRMGLAWLARLEGEPEKALVVYAGIKGPDIGSEIWLMGQIAQTLTEAGRDDDAQAAWKRLLNRYSGNAEAEVAGFNGLAAFHHAKDEMELALNLYERVAKKALDPSQRDWARLNAATIRTEMGDSEDAFFDLDALQKTTADPEVRLQAKLVMTGIYMELGRPDQALKLLEGVDAGALGPAYVASLTQCRVQALLAKGEIDEAARAWEAVLSEFGNADDAATPARLGLADLAVQMGEVERALVLYDEAFEATRDRFYQAWALLGKANALKSEGRTTEAIELYDRIVEDYADQGAMADAAREARIEH
jgi:uncharacterized protein YjbI with pentapeptide repeats/tetratricopeptide (TPR) repeat protein